MAARFGSPNPLDSGCTLDDFMAKTAQRRHDRYVKGMRRIRVDRAQHGGDHSCPCFEADGYGPEFARFADTPSYRRPYSYWESRACLGMTPQELRQVDEYRHPRAKKNTKRWCKGKVGREHAVVVEQKSWYGKVRTWVRRCANCGKVLDEYYIGSSRWTADDVPDWVPTP